MPTRSSLSRRGVLVGPSGCVLCQGSVETSHHLFFGMHSSTIGVVFVSKVDGDFVCPT